MTKLSSDQVKQIAELREAGWSYVRLAKKFEVSAGAISYRCLVEGALSPKSQPLVPPNMRRPNRGYGGTCRPFSEEEDAQLLAMARDGVKIDKIAATLKRARTSTRIRLLTLELKSDMQPEIAL